MGPPTGNSVPRGSLDKNRKHVLCILWFAQNILGSEIFSVVKIQQYLREKKKSVFKGGSGEEASSKITGTQCCHFLGGKGLSPVLLGPASDTSDNSVPRVWLTVTNTSI